jgi:predicted transcriptional regulator
MKPYCEIASQYLLPTIRALTAKTLMEKHGMTQQVAATKLGLTQSAVSQYMRQLRGSNIKILEKDKVIMDEIEKFASKIASNQLSSLGTMDEFCLLCKAARRRKILCELHVKYFPDLKDCNICMK